MCMWAWLRGVSSCKTASWIAWQWLRDLLFRGTFAVFLPTLDQLLGLVVALMLICRALPCSQITTAEGTGPVRRRKSETRSGVRNMEWSHLRWSLKGTKQSAEDLVSVPQHSYRTITVSDFKQSLLKLRWHPDSLNLLTLDQQKTSFSLLDKSLLQASITTARKYTHYAD